MSGRVCRGRRAVLHRGWARLAASRLNSTEACLPKLPAQNCRPGSIPLEHRVPTSAHEAAGCQLECRGIAGRRHAAQHIRQRTAQGRPG